MEKKIRVWLVVLLFLLLAALAMCVSFKLRLDDVNEKYNAVISATPEATLEATLEATPEVTPDATATEEPTVAGYTAEEVEAMCMAVFCSTASNCALSRRLASSARHSEHISKCSLTNRAVSALTISSTKSGSRSLTILHSVFTFYSSNPSLIIFLAR